MSEEALRRAIEVRAPVAHAFRVFTERLDGWWPRGHRRFSASTLCLEAGEGGRFFERAASGEEAELGVVLLWEPPHRLRYAWYPGAASGPTEVEVCFLPTPEGTRVEITHTAGGDATAWETRAVRFSRGWEVVLPAFQDAVHAATPEET